MEPVDDHLLAAFVGGTATPEQRAHVMRHLASDPDTREIVGMARQALSAATPDARAPLPRRRLRRSPMLVRCTFGALALLAGSAVVRLATQPAPGTNDRLRTQTERAPLTVRLDGHRFHWTPVPGAVRYEIVVWDAVTASVSARAVSRTPETGDGFAAALDSLRRSGTEQQVRVDAFDVENRLLSSSALTPVGP